jgi:hypothetical protein
MAGRSPKAPPPVLKPKSPPRRVEIRIDGRLQFIQDCYDIALTLDNDVVTFTAAVQPTMVSAPTKGPSMRFDDDPRDGEEVIQKVHSGRQIAAPSPKEG